MKKIVCIICLIVSFVSANNIIPDPYKGQVYYKYYVGINLGMDGTEFTKKYTKDEWGEVFANRGEAFFKEFNLSRNDINEEILVHLEAFSKHYAKDSDLYPNCDN